MQVQAATATFKTIQSQLYGKKSDQIIALQNLSKFLLYQQNEVKLICSYDAILIQLINMLATSVEPDIIDQASLCIFSILESIPSYSQMLFSTNGIAVLASRLLDVVTIPTAEFCIRALDIVSNYSDYGVRLGQLIGIEPFLKHIELFNTNEQETAIRTVARITNSYVTDVFAAELHKIVSLTTSPETSISYNAVAALNNIASRVRPKSVSREVLSQICIATGKAEDTDVISQLLGALFNLSTKRSMITTIINSHINYDRILFSPTIINNTADFQKRVFKLINNLLPCPKHAEMFIFPRHRRPPESKDFAIEIQPTVLKVLTERPLYPERTLIALAATLVVNPFHMNEKLLASLMSFAPIPSTAPVVLSLLTYFDDLQIISDSDILQTLKKVSVEDSYKVWFQRTITAITRRINQNIEPIADLSNVQSLTLKDIIKMITEERVSKFAFLTSGLLERCVQLLDQPTDLEDMKTLQAYALDILSFLHPAPLGQMCPTESFSKLAAKGINTTIVTASNERYQLKIMPFDSLISIEGWYNSNVRGFDAQRLQVVMNQNLELKSLIVIDTEKRMPESQLALLYRAFSEDSYPKLHMQISDRLYSSNDSIFTALCDCACEPENVFDMGLMIELLDGDIEQTPPILKIGPIQRSLKVFELLLRLHYYTKEPAYNSSFCSRIMNMLSEPLASVGRFSSAMATIFKYPFLFDFKTRLYWLKLATFDPLSSIRIFSRIFGAGLLPKIPEQEVIHVKVHRDSIFTDGVLIFQHFARNRMNLDVTFLGDIENGPNSVQEFFSLLSKEFTRTKRYFFGSENIDSEFCESPKGLFFSPAADPKYFTVFGIFLAKCILLECTIDLDMNPAFFSFIRSGPVSLDDVSPNLSSYIQDKNNCIGQTFTYPGLPWLELCEDGKEKEVNEENIFDYLKLVEDFTCGEHLRDHADAFRKGFSSIIPWNSLEIFTEEEICLIIKGEEPIFTMEDLQAAIQPGVGNSSDSPQIRMFDEVLLEMSIPERKALFQYITGTPRLPPGGVKAINPKITISMRFFNDGEIPDNEDPIISGRSNVLKIPDYSSKDVLRTKLLAASHYNQ